MAGAHGWTRSIAGATVVGFLAAGLSSPAGAVEPMSVVFPAQISVTPIDAIGTVHQVVPVSARGCASWQVGAAGSSGPMSITGNSSYRQQGITVLGNVNALGTVVVKLSFGCESPLRSFEVTASVAVVAAAPTPSPSTTTSPTTAPPVRQGSGFWSERSKQVAAQARDNLRAYARNANAVSDVCVVSSIKKTAIKESLKVVAKDLAVAQLPVIGDIPTDPCSITIAAFSAALELEAHAWDALANDPPNPDYRRNVEITIRVPLRFEGSGTLAATAEALNGFVEAHADVHANLEALLVAVERAQGAERAKDKKWQSTQEKASRRLAGAAATGIENVAEQLEALATALREGGYVDDAPRHEDVAAARSARPPGMTTATRATMTAFGLDAQDVSEFEAATADGWTQAVALPRLISDSSLLRTLRVSAAQLREVTAPPLKFPAGTKLLSRQQVAARDYGDALPTRADFGQSFPSLGPPAKEAAVTGGLNFPVCTEPIDPAPTAGAGVEFTGATYSATVRVVGWSETGALSFMGDVARKIDGCGATFFSGSSLLRSLAGPRLPKLGDASTTWAVSSVPASFTVWYLWIRDAQFAATVVVSADPGRLRPDEFESFAEFIAKQLRALAKK